MNAHAPILTRGVLEGFEAPPTQRPSAWAEQNVMIDQGARHGPLRHINAPYLPGILDLANASGVVQLNVMKAAQIGVSAMARWLMGYWATHSPDPMGLTLPDEKKGRDIVNEYVIPFFKRTPVLSALLTERKWDAKSDKISLANGFVMRLMWGSATSMASHPLRRVILDEVDKMKSWNQGEAHAVFLTAKRLRTYEDRACQVNISTPTTTLGMMHKLFDGSDVQLHFLIPCPHCGERIRLVWDHVKFEHCGDLPVKDWAAHVEREEAAWYECQACGEKIDDRDRRKAVQCGKWGTCDDHGIGDGLIDDANAVEKWPKGTRIGVQISALYVMWGTLASVAAEFIRATEDVGAMFDFRTQTLGEAFEELVKSASANRFDELAATSPLAEGVVPVWASTLIATVDTQIDHFWIVVRAWGPQMRSARVFHGRVESFEDVDKLCFGTPWQVDQNQFAAMACDLVLIDSGGTRHEGATMSRTMEVYKYCLEREGHVRAIKGESKPQPGRYYRRGRGWFDPGERGTERVEVPLWLLDVGHYQDMLAELIDRRITATDENGDATTERVWHLNARTDSEYSGHMSNLVKVAQRDGAEIVTKWKPKTGGARVDLRDCEGYQVAAAYMHRIHLLPPLADFMEQKRAELAAVNQQAQNPRSGTGRRTPDGRSFISTQR